MCLAKLDKTRTFKSLTLKKFRDLLSRLYVTNVTLISGMETSGTLMERKTRSFL